MGGSFQFAGEFLSAIYERYNWNVENDELAVFLKNLNFHSKVYCAVKVVNTVDIEGVIKELKFFLACAEVFKEQNINFYGYWPARDKNTNLREAFRELLLEKSCTRIYFTLIVAIVRDVADRLEEQNMLRKMSRAF